MAAAGASAGAVVAAAGAVGACCSLVSVCPPASPCMSTLSPILNATVRAIAANRMNATRIFYMIVSKLGLNN